MPTFTKMSCLPGSLTGQAQKAPGERRESGESEDAYVIMRQDTAAQMCRAWEMWAGLKEQCRSKAELKEEDYWGRFFDWTVLACMHVVL